MTALFTKSEQKWSCGKSWGDDLFSDTLDRLRHNAYCLTLDGESFRTPKQPPAARQSSLAKQVKSANP